MISENKDPAMMRFSIVYYFLIETKYMYFQSYIQAQ